MILQSPPAAAGNIGTVGGVGQILFDIGLVRSADKTGQLTVIAGTTDGGLQLLNGLAEARQQRQFQQQSLLLGLLGSGTLYLDHRVDGVAYGEGVFTGNITQSLAQIYQAGLVSLFCEDGFAV